MIRDSDDPKLPTAELEGDFGIWLLEYQTLTPKSEAWTRKPKS